MQQHERPVRVALVNDHPIAIAGLAILLAPYAGRARVIDLEGEPSAGIDVVLYGTIGEHVDQGRLLRRLLPGSRVRAVLFTDQPTATVVDQAFLRGASGYLLKSLDGERLLAGIEAVHRGSRVLGEPPADSVPVTGGPRTWPGRDVGLTEREAIVLAWITRGVSNQEIADTLYISINSIKVYIRRAYSKIGVRSRTQAVIYGIRNGFDSYAVPEPSEHPGSRLRDRIDAL